MCYQWYHREQNQPTQQRQKDIENEHKYSNTPHYSITTGTFIVIVVVIVTVVVLATEKLTIEVIAV